MPVNSFQLIRFGENIVKYFSSKFKSDDYFLLSINESIFQEILYFDNKNINKDSLLENLREIVFDWDRSDKNYDERCLIAIAIAAYQVLLASETGGINTRKTFLENYNTEPNPKCSQIWKTAKSYFFEKCKLNLCIPNSGKVNFVSYPNYQVLNSSQQKNIFYIFYQLKNLPNKQNYNLCDFEEISLNYKERLSFIENLIFDAYPKCSYITFSNKQKILAFFLFINYPKWNGQNPSGPDSLLGKHELDNQYINSSDDDEILVLLENDNSYTFKLYKNDLCVAFDNRSILEKVHARKYICFFHNPSYDDELEDIEKSDFSDEDMFLLTELSIPFEKYIVQRNLLDFQGLNLFHFDFSKQSDSSLYQQLKMSLNNKKASNSVELLGGIKIGYNYLEGCTPEIIAGSREYLPNLDCGTKIIETSLHDKIRISVIPAKDTPFTGELGFRNIGTELLSMQGLNLTIFNISKDILELDNIDKCDINWINDFFEQLVTLKYPYLNKKSKLFAFLKRCHYGR